MGNSRFIRSYNIFISDELKNVSWITDQDLWLTEYGLLTDIGFRDHYGHGALKVAQKTVENFNHLRFCPSVKDRFITDGLGRDGLNLFHHPFLSHCWFNTMWRFNGDDGRKTLSVYGDIHAFYGFIESFIEAVSVCNGDPYIRPANLFAGSVRLDH
jgi:hypothetical protein